MIITSFTTLAVLIILFAIFIFADIKSDKKFRTVTLRKLFGVTLEPLMLKNLSAQKLLIKKILFYAGIFLIIIAASDPRWGKKDTNDASYPTPESATEGIDIMIAVDVSKSMLASDIKPNRLENAKTALKLLLGGDILSGNRVGVVAFAGSSFVECPLTTDIGAAALFIDELKTDLIPVGGTDIGGAIRNCIKALSQDTDGKSSAGSKAIILITDGEDNEGAALEAAREAGEQNIKIYPIGIGSETGETVPEIDEDGNIVGVKRDRKGNIVLSRLDAGLLKNIAAATGGNAFILKEENAASVLPGLLSAISSIPKHKIKQTGPAYGYKERFQIFLLSGILCLLADFSISPYRRVNNDA